MFHSRKGVPGDLRLLIEALPARAPLRVLVVQDRGAVVGLGVRRCYPEASVTVHHLDAYEAARSRDTLARNEAQDVTIAVTADLPGFLDSYDLVIARLPSRGEALLAREWIEGAHALLAPGGRFLAGSDGSLAWVRDAVRDVFGEAFVPRQQKGLGGVVSAQRRKAKTRRPARLRTYSVDRSKTTLRISTRPGVFSHGRLDAGTKALLSAFEAVRGSCVLDLGSGVGPLGLAAALDVGPQGAVTLVDSNARAAALASSNAADNGLTHAQVLLRENLEDLPGGFGLVLANPPYFGRGRIAQAFCSTAARSLAHDGRLLLVAKARELHEDAARAVFHRVAARSVGDYWVLDAREPISPDAVNGEGAE